MVCITAGASCVGTLGGGEGDQGTAGVPGAGEPGHPPSTIDPAGLPGPELAAPGRLLRLTIDEYNRTLLLLVGGATNAGSILPQDARNPFDNDYGAQQVSSSFIGGAELVAGDVSTRLLADKARRDRVVGCAPKTAAGADAVDCLRRFVTRFARLAWRRTLTEEDIAGLMKLQALARLDDDFYSAVDGVIRAVLQDPEFLYRVETGTPVPGAPGLFRLTGLEMASRLSFFLWGSAPDDELITLAESGGLATPDDVRRAAGSMLTRPAALARMARFHALWMAYEHVPQSPLALAMKAETDALMARVIFEKQQPWQDLFRSRETYVTYDLARHYGLSRIPGTLKPGSSARAWIPYEGTKRQGLLSHASFLQLGVKNGDTHPVLRGKGIRELLFCQPPPPPPPNVAAGMKTTSPCKREKLMAHAAGSCASCHALMDPVGFGLESYGPQGEYRIYDKDPDTGKDLTECRISGDGDLDGAPFNGPAGLAELVLADQKRLNSCAVKQLYRFATGTCGGGAPPACNAKLDDRESQFIDVLAKRTGTSDFRFDELLLDFVSSEGFGHLRWEP